MKKIFDTKYLKNVGVYIFVTAVSAAFIFYLGYHLSNNLKSGINFTYAVSESTYDTVRASGYIMKKETVLPSSVSGGVLVPVAEDGEHVSAGAEVGEIYSSSSANTKKLRQLEDELEFYEKVSGGFITLGSAESVSGEIDLVMTSVRAFCEDGNLSSAVSSRTSLIQNILKEKALTAGGVNYADRISAIREEISSLKASFGSISGTVSSPSAGYYYSETDGYEELFSASKIDSVTISEFEEMISESDSITAPGGNAGKIVTDYKWYVACLVGNTEGAKLKEGHSYLLSLQNNPGETIETEAYRIAVNGEKALVILKCDSIPKSFDFTRMQQIEILLSESSVFRIPSSALRYCNDYEGVYILNEVTVEFRRVDVTGEDGDFYLCAAEHTEEDEEDKEEEETHTGTEGNDYPYLKENDVVIVGGTGLYEGMTYDPKRS